MTSSPESQQPDDVAQPESEAAGASEPIGQLLKRAGLLSDAQIQLALMDQGHHNLMFGEILVMRGWLKPQTLRFFLDTFRRAQEASQHQPLTAPMPQMAAPSSPPVDPVASPQPPVNRAYNKAKDDKAKDPAPVPTLSAELSGLLDPINEFEPLEASTTTPDDLSQYLTSSSRIPKRNPPPPAARRPKAGPKTNSIKIDGFALEAEDESLDLSFEEGLSEAELRAMLDLD